MAKSKIIKEFAGSNIDTYTALKNLKVLLHSLNDDRLIDWVNNELQGYNESSQLPNYRIIIGRLFGTIVNIDFKYTHYPLNLLYCSEDEKKDILSSPVYQSISSLQSIVNNSTTTSKQLSPTLYDNLVMFCGINGYIIEAKVEYDYTTIQDILSKIDNKILDTLLTLEKEFGNLDNLDIDISEKGEEKLKGIIQNISIILYDNSVTIGDNNTFKKSSVTTNK